MGAGSGRVVTAHQPSYLPWLGLLHKIALADLYVHFDDVLYHERDWHNRNKINGPHGPIWLSVPVLKGQGGAVKLKDALVRDDMPWRRKHWRSILLSYKKAPHAGRYLPFFEALYARPWERLAELNEHVLGFCMAELGIAPEIRWLSRMELTGSGSQLVLDMCREVGADLYLFGAFGRDYADEAAFARAGVRVEYQDYQHPRYPQIHGAFASHLSVVDLLFNCGPDSRDILLSGNITREELRGRHFGR